MIMSTLGGQPEPLRKDREHLRAPSRIFEHNNATDHTTSVKKQ